MKVSHSRMFLCFGICAAIFSFVFLPAQQAQSVQQPRLGDKFQRQTKSDSTLEPDAHSEGYLIFRYPATGQFPHRQAGVFASRGQMGIHHSIADYRGD